jgi:DNA repair protein RecN (Recombination protein N)
MLTALAIRDVVLIEALDLEFGEGLGVLTGETGAGKSILLDALGLALGARGESGLVRQGASQAMVTASFETPRGRRDRQCAGAERARCSNRASPARPPHRQVGRRQPRLRQRSARLGGLLRELAPHLVEIHGQHDDRGLLNPRGHRALLDSFGRIDIGPVAMAHKRVARGRGRARRGARRTGHRRARPRMARACRRRTAGARARAGRGGDLAERRATMQRGEKVAGELQGIADLLEGSEGGLSQLAPGRAHARTHRRRS